MKKIFNIIAIIALVVALVALARPAKIVEENAGGLIHNTAESFDEGIEVDGQRIVTGDGSFITQGKVYDFGNASSTSITAEMLCEGQDNIAYNTFTIDSFETAADPDDTGASISFSNDETFTAIQDCIEDQGDWLTFTVEQSASTATAYLDVATSGLVYSFASTQTSDWNTTDLMIVTVRNFDGTSISFEFDVVETDEK